MPNQSPINDPFEPIIHRLEDYACKEANCLLIGARGVGKTSLVIEIANKLGLTLAYFSAPTLDPWADLIGVPLPKGDNLTFLRPERVNQAEFLFLDELNRAHPRVQNAVLELTLFKSLNGQRLENLKMVWAAINPADEGYQVFDLDAALQDRFPFQVVLPSQPSPTFFRHRFPESVAQALLAWWHRDLNEAQRKAITPRRLEAIGEAYCQGLALDDCIPYGATAPISLLQRALNQGDHLRLEDILKNPLHFVNAVRSDLDMDYRLLLVMDNCNHEELYDLHALILEFPREILKALCREHNNTYGKLLKAVRIKEGHPASEQYKGKIEELTHAA